MPSDGKHVRLDRTELGSRWLGSRLADRGGHAIETRLCARRSFRYRPSAAKRLGEGVLSLTEISRPSSPVQGEPGRKPPNRRDEPRDRRPTSLDASVSDERCIAQGMQVSLIRGGCLCERSIRALSGH
jgi:hypothetical protein